MAEERSYPEVVRGALRVRRWAVEVLCHAESQGPAAGSPPTAPPVPAAAWRLALATERCAVPLHARLSAAGWLASVPPVALEVLERLRVRELQRILSAQAQLRWMTKLAGGFRSRLVVLKGGAHLMSGALVDVLDVDLLVAREELPAFVEAMEARGGYLKEAAHAARDNFESSHWAPRFLPGSVPVEVHFRVRGIADLSAAMDRAVPIASAPGLHRLHPVDHLSHLLFHTVVQHAYAQGRIRDLLLIGPSAAACTVQERRAALEGLGSAEARATGEAVLAMADALSGGTPPPDPFLTTAAVRCICATRGAGGRAAEGLQHSALMLLEGTGPYLRYLHSLVQPGVMASVSPAVRRLGGMSPALAGVLLGAVRLGTAGLLLGPAVRIARQARRLAGEVS